MIDKDLITYLRAQVTRAGSRVYTGSAPQQSEFPLVIVRRSGGNTPRTLAGVKLFTRTTYNIMAVGKHYDDSVALAAELRTALDGLTGRMPATTGTDVKSCRCIAEPTDISETDGDLVLRGVMQEFLFVYVE